jgi:putative peptidoglycan lipid II flippase
VALGVVLLPQLSARSAGDDAAGYSGLIDWGLRLVLLLALPCALALLIVPQALVAVLYHYGAFTGRDVLMTVRALQGYGVGLVGLVAIKILAPAFYARQDVRTPVKIALLVLAITQALNLALVPALGHAGLALSIGLAALVNAVLLLRGLLVRGVYRPAPGWGRFALQLLLANAVLAAALVAVALAVDWVALQSRWALRVGGVAGLIAGAALLYFGVLAACGVRPRQFARRG